MSGFVFSEKPISIATGEGATLTAENGTDYLDFGASYACTPTGHCHPDVVEAVQKQAGELLYVQGSYPVQARADLHEKLGALAPDGIENVWLCNSGTEANEAALKFARSATDGTKIVAAKRAFHGRTAGTLSATWKPKYKKPFEPLLEDQVEFVTYGDAGELESAVDDDTAAVILEPIQGEGGIHPAPQDYLETAREATEATDTALIFDEIQTGIGRTGEFWACEGSGVTPDILTTAKGIASGLPMGATLCADWIAEASGPHGSTFSGNPLVSAAANATLDVVVEEDLPGNAAEIGGYLQDELAALDVPLRDVRGEGLLLGVEVKRGANGVLRDLALEHQILALPAGRSVVRLLPPLVVDEAAADQVVTALADVLAPEAEAQAES
ncbi:acetylornithine aminotransferase [Natrialba magadii ATCC 43099]|uniref:Putative [LysW]-aminoadipate semialdehyde/glutamate semialdehyde transaminase n=1 Tax=Natrialba magadii (strain ATCC 43099 / DSM 3394 / CCM 3739 / CIP 104546 / IAM 13178 / JCM 8861 / NBRC 102185 / NCIMB 2190 / MS3) TaxID=547559 RepID=D3SUS4_NATMM|nr:aminotransferase class III-fold pyridoxal phosphate-dependent enzyme [Natrialba magadii]ADD05332.1 acetylornithine aminotransferase [Natrialba magadii ATCC 43099]ELY29350.1 acetylornithine aminotransferase [Natrialba magadii ATCC 43099]